VQARALGGLARVALRAGDTQRTRELALEALELSEDEAAQWSPRHLLAAVVRADGDYDRAEELYGETLALARRLELRLQEAAELLNLGYVALHRGDTELAVERFGQSLEIGAELDDDYLLPYCLLGAGSSALARGDHGEAARLLAAAKATFDRAGAAIDPRSAGSTRKRAPRLEASTKPSGPKAAGSASPKRSLEPDELVRTNRHATEFAAGCGAQG
jgi:tetratricopeptide (TPR) repeat protein